MLLMLMAPDSFSCELALCCADVAVDLDLKESSYCRSFNIFQHSSSHIPEMATIVSEVHQIFWSHTQCAGIPSTETEELRQRLPEAEANFLKRQTVLDASSP